MLLSIPNVSASSAAMACQGDRDGDSTVVVAEIVRGVDIALGGAGLTSGRSKSATHEAIKAFKAEKLEVVSVLALVDREEENGLEKIRKPAAARVPVHVVFKKSELHARWLERTTGRQPHSSLEGVGRGIKAP